MSDIVIGWPASEMSGIDTPPSDTAWKRPGLQHRSTAGRTHNLGYVRAAAVARLVITPHWATLPARPPPTAKLIQIKADCSFLCQLKPSPERVCPPGRTKMNSRLAYAAVALLFYPALGFPPQWRRRTRPR